MCITCGTSGWTDVTCNVKLHLKALAKQMVSVLMSEAGMRVNVVDITTRTFLLQ